MRYYFSGVDQSKHLALLAREGAAAMFNARTATQPALISACKRWPDVPKVLDSGAVQGETDVEKYANIVAEVGEYYQWCANLDVIGDQAASDRNYAFLTRENDWVKILWIYQVEGGLSLNGLDHALANYDHIGVGGLVPILQKEPAKAARLIGAIGDLLHQHKVKAHFFGLGAFNIILAYHNMEWFDSADSSTWLMGYSHRAFIGSRGQRVLCRTLDLLFSEEECAAQNVRQVHSWCAGESLQYILDFLGGSPIPKEK